jgi:hypothetical protein
MGLRSPTLALPLGPFAAPRCWSASFRVPVTELLE